MKTAAGKTLGAKLSVLGLVAILGLVVALASSATAGVPVFFHSVADDGGMSPGLSFSVRTTAVLHWQRSKGEGENYLVCGCRGL